MLSGRIGQFGDSNRQKMAKSCSLKSIAPLAQAFVRFSPQQRRISVAGNAKHGSLPSTGIAIKASSSLAAERKPRSDLNPRAMTAKVRGFVSLQSWFLDPIYNQHGQLNCLQIRQYRQKASSRRRKVMKR